MGIINLCWQTIQIQEAEVEMILPKVKATKIQIEFAEPIVTTKCLVGIDPGTTHLGIAILDAPNCANKVCYATLYQINMTRETTATKRKDQLYSILNTIRFPSIQKKVVIEGADYGATYRQVELAEIRMAALTWFKDTDSVEIIPIKTIRKAVFGDGNMLPTEYWKNLAKYPDAAQGLACSLYSIK